MTPAAAVVYPGGAVQAGYRAGTGTAGQGSQYTTAPTCTCYTDTAPTCTCYTGQGREVYSGQGRKVYSGQGRGGSLGRKRFSRKEEVSLRRTRASLRGIRASLEEYGLPIVAQRVPWHKSYSWSAG